jgi:hypothetical protein
LYNYKSIKTEEYFRRFTGFGRRQPSWALYDILRAYNPSKGIFHILDFRVLDPPHLSSSCPLAHKALTHCFHLLLSLATAVTDAQLFHPSSVLSCSVVLLHVVFGPPTFLFIRLSKDGTYYVMVLSVLPSVCPWSFTVFRTFFLSSLQL